EMKWPAQAEVRTRVLPVRRPDNSGCTMQRPHQGRAVRRTREEQESVIALPGSGGRTTRAVPRRTVYGDFIIVLAKKCPVSSKARAISSKTSTMIAFTTTADEWPRMRL